MPNYRIYYSPHYYADIGEGHVFPIRKFELARDVLIQEGTLTAEQLIEPAPADIEDLLLVHTNDYISRLIAGELTAKEVRRLGLPWSMSLVRRSLHAISGTIMAAKSALNCGISLTSPVERIMLTRTAGKGFVFLTMWRSPLEFFSVTVQSGGF
jgi:acetoin utilization deacetylase AcuC-like enzyme